MRMVNVPSSLRRRVTNGPHLKTPLPHGHDYSIRVPAEEFCPWGGPRPRPPGLSAPQVIGAFRRVGPPGTAAITRVVQLASVAEEPSPRGPIIRRTPPRE